MRSGISDLRNREAAARNRQRGWRQHGISMRRQQCCVIDNITAKMYTSGSVVKPGMRRMAQDESTGKPPSAGSRVCGRLWQAAAAHAVPERDFGKPARPPAPEDRSCEFADRSARPAERSNRRQPRTRREAVIAALVEKSASGDLPATKLLFELLRQIGPAAEPPASPEDDPREILLQRLARLAGDHDKPTSE